MAASKKTVKQRETPSARGVRQFEDPDAFYSRHPYWSFSNCDKERWAFTAKGVGNAIWTEILPRLQSWESQLWSDILLKAKESNHYIDVKTLNSVAKKRLTEMYLEYDAIVSLRLSSTHRIYGYIGENRSFFVLWYDPNHGDNDECVCRSHMKYT